MKYFDNIVNPIAEARIADGYSLRRLGNKLGLSAQYISRAEHGTYSDVNDALIKYAGSILELAPEDVFNRYKNFQEETRRRTARELKPKKLMRGNSILPGHELFTEWREIYWTSGMAFSNAFCVHPDMVGQYEDGVRPVMPNQIQRALWQVELIERDWSEVPIPGKRISAFGPIAKQQLDEHRNTSGELVIPVPVQRAQEPF